MTRKRKTFKVQDLKVKVNYYLLNSSNKFNRERQGALNTLETLLHDTGNYQGFGYLTRGNMESSENGTSVGINTKADGWVEKDYDKRFKNTDSTRVYYF